VFTRGQTQSLGVLTLGTSADTQDVDDLEEVTSKRFFLHYNFPSFSVGEVRPVRGPGRREIGHGRLAERSVAPVLPDAEEFPYTVRVVSEILESNGSSSMASVCSATLALMDGGVPLKAPVAGIAMGLILEGDKFAILSDIMGLEDHLGDMDFKVAGTKDGITALQMDIKIEGVTLEIMAKALTQAKAGREHILNKMLEAMPASRKELKETAPRIQSIMIDPEKIRDVIGSGGKVIREITAKTGAKIDIEDSGKISIASSDGAAMDRAIKWIKDIVSDAELNAVYNGKVVRIAEFGAFVEILPGKDGLLHVSEIENYRVNRVEDVLKLGDEVQVKVIGIEPNGKVRLSRRAVLYGDTAESSRKEGGDRGDRGDRGGRGDRKGGRGDRPERGDRAPRSEGAPSGERRAPSARVEAVLTRAADRLKAASQGSAAEASETGSSPAGNSGASNAGDGGFDPFARRFDDSIERPDND
jgi:polyribonucleotide nucleotidyltransferase